MRFETAREAANSTGVPEYRIRQLIKAERVPGFYAGKKYLINVDAFLEVLQQMCSESVTTNNNTAHNENSFLA